MREIVIGGRSIVVTHVRTDESEFGDIQRFRIEITESSAVTHLSILRPSAEVDARVMASVIDAELLLGCEVSTESGLLRDPSVRSWRDANSRVIEDTWQKLQSDIFRLPPAPIGEAERALLRAFRVTNDDSKGATDD